MLRLTNKAGRVTNMRRRAFLKLVGGAGTGLSLSPSIVGAQVPWPSRPVKIIVPFGAGGGTDHLARYWAEKLGVAFGPAVRDREPWRRLRYDRHGGHCKGRARC